MTRRLASSLAILAFDICVMMGIAAENTFATTIERALGAMVVTLVVGLVVGAMAQKMLDESIESAKKSELTEAKSDRTDR